MTRHRYIQASDGKLIDADEYFEEAVLAPLVMPDIQPYKSMADGTMIMSRSQHREHLKRHNCIEIGNETAHLLKPPKHTEVAGRKELIIAQINEMGHERFKKAMKADLDNLRWNTRKD